MFINLAHSNKEVILFISISKMPSNDYFVKAPLSSKISGRIRDVEILKSKEGIVGGGVLWCSFSLS